MAKTDCLGPGPTQQGIRIALGRPATVGAVVLANALEWYEIVVYGYMAGIIAHVFFPATSSTAALLLTFASFGLTYVARPLGAVILGAYGDRHGRKPALQISIWMMAIGSAAIAFTPGYGTISVLAPVVVVSARLLQGFAAGGEFGSATAFLVEQDRVRSGYFGSWQFASQGLSALLAAGVCTAVSTLLTDDQLRAWGWRLPFLFGLCIYPVGIYIRAKLNDTLEHAESETARPPVHAGLRQNWRSILVVLGLVVLGTVAVYTIVFLPTYAVREMSLPASHGFAAGLLTAGLQLALIPLFGIYSDRHGRTLTPLIAAVIALIGAYPAFAWLSVAPSFAKLLAVQALFGLATAAYLGPLPALMAEMFPVRARTFGLSICYAVGVAVFGGLAPLIHTALIAVTGDPASPSFYLIAAAVVSLAALTAARRMGFR